MDPNFDHLDLRPENRQGLSEPPLRYDEDGVLLRSNTSEQWRRDGTNQRPTPEMTTSLNNLHAFFGHNNTIYEEFQDRGVTQQMLHDMAPSIVAWDMRRNPRAIEPRQDWTVATVRPAVDRVFGNLEGGDRWQQTWVSNFADTEEPGSPKIVCGAVVKVTKINKAPGRNQNGRPCPYCVIGQEVYVRMIKNDKSLVPGFEVGCHWSHYQIAGNYQFYGNTNAEDWIAALIAQSDEDQLRWAALYNERFLVHTMRSIIRWPVLGEDARRQAILHRGDSLPVTELLEVRMKMQEPKIKVENFMHGFDKAARRLNGILPVEAASGEAHRLEGELGTAQARVMEVEGQVANLEGQVTDLQGQVTNLQAAAANPPNAAGPNPLQAEVDRLTRETRTMQLARDAATQARDALRVQLQHEGHVPNA